MNWIRPWLGLALASVGLTLQTAQALPPEVTVFPGGSASRPRLAWSLNRTNWGAIVETRDSLSSGAWLPAPGGNWPTTNNNWAAPEGVGTGSHFYRVTAIPPVGQRGRLVSHTLVGPYQPLLLGIIFHGFGIDISTRYPVEFHAVTYETIDPYGAPTLASGAVILPVGKTNASALVLYDHGTSIKKTDVPSKPNKEGFLGTAFATDGYVAVLPDYLGLGSSPGLHPYLHAASEASASIDLLRAARQLCASNTVALSDQLFVSGYSQGGHAALATLRALEADETHEFAVTAAGCGSGPYDLAGVSATDFLSGRVPPNPYYFLYLFAAFQDVYGLAPSLAALLRPPYSTTLPPLLDGLHDGDVINAAMPKVPTDILAPAQLADFKVNPNNPLRLALVDNTLLNWTPKSPLRLYRCSGDQDVLPYNSQVAYDTFQSRGATQVQWLDPDPGADHETCSVPALLSIKAWFDTLRK